jgi:hypothetical protein
MESGRLDNSQYRAAARMLEKKCRIYAAGCEKRGKIKEAAFYRSFPEKQTAIQAF